MFIPFNLSKKILFAGLFSLLLFSCGGGSDDDDMPDIDTPSNLVIEATIWGANATFPNGDGSGTVTLNFSADNTTLYKINMGNGEIKETSSNELTYTYSGAGLKTFEIYISAYNGNKVISTSTTITIKINSGLLWADEFDTPGSPDNNKWNYDIGTGDWGWGNNEAQYYTNRSENVKVEGGFLKITAKKESYQGAEYTSTRMKTQGKFDFTYGKVEVRAKLPVGVGTWPAIWMLGSNITTVGWPACGEADIMEHVGKRQGWVSSAMHTPSSYGNTQNHGEQYFEDVSTEFHVYAVEWTEEKMVFSVDDKVHYTYNPSTKNSSTWPFDANQFLILNVALGGNWGGTIDPNFSSSTMEIDYVRVYQ